MKFRQIEIGNITLDVRVVNTWRGVYLAAYEPDHSRAHSSGEEVHRVAVTDSGNAINDFEVAFTELNLWLLDNANSVHTHLNPQRSRRSFYEIIKHLCNYH